MIGDASETVRMLQRARAEGFTSSVTLERDAAFAELQRRADFQQELKEAKVTERVARKSWNAPVLYPFSAPGNAEADGHVRNTA